MPILTKVLKHLNDTGLSLAVDKCRFGKDKLIFLGFNLSSSGISPVEEKISAIKQCEPPTTQKKLLGFLGAISYYHHCLPPLQTEAGKLSATEVLQPLYTAAIKKLPPKTSFQTVWKQDSTLNTSFNQNLHELLFFVQLFVTNH